MITKLQKQARQLRAQITEAFDDVSYPGDDNLYDGLEQRDSDYYDVIRNLTGKHWRDLIPKRKPPKEFNTPLSKDMHFLSPEAWHFFLPAHLITETMRENIRSFDFEPSLSERMGDYSERRFSRLNAKQSAAVVSYLEYAKALVSQCQIRGRFRAAYYEKQRQQLETVQSYWNDRLKAL